MCGTLANHLPSSLRLLVVIGFAAVCGLAAVVELHASDSAVEPGLSYQKDIRPILAANCFKCHGPDEDGARLTCALTHRLTEMRI